MFRYKIGHRGAPREFPANTMQSFRRAIELGCDMIECDIQQASDGIPVLAHDPKVTDKSGREYIIAEQTSAMLAALDLDAGEGVPTLSEMVAWSDGVCSVMPDMKVEGNGIEEAIVAALSFLPVESKIVTGASETARRRFRALDPTLRLSFTVDTANGAQLDVPNLGERVTSLFTDAVTWEYPLLTSERVADLHAHGLTVFAWTVDDLDIMRRLLDMGVDGIISNRPELLANF